MMPGDTVSLRLMTRYDYPLLDRWLAAPHVQRWWGAVPASIEAKYGPRIDRQHPTSMFVILHNGRSVGVLQSYWMTHEPEHAARVGVINGVGVDLFIGEVALIGQGIGTRTLQYFIAEAADHSYPGWERIVADPDVENIGSVTAFQKAGFVLTRTVEMDDGSGITEAVLIFER